jgi:hypothetical protein
MTISAKTKKTIEGVYNLAVKPGTEAEGENAKEKLEKLCKKHKVRLADLIKDCKFDFDFSEKPANTGAENKPSRRSLIIAAIQEGGWTTAKLARHLKDTYAHLPDFKANKKAVAGTIYDMRRNKNWDIRISDDAVITVKSTGVTA